jgi:O-antigen ligase
MPSGHNGYIDTLLGTGLAGLILLLSILIAALNASQNAVERSARLGSLIISLLLFTIVHNGLETTFLRGASTIWIIFVILLTVIASVAGKHSQVALTRQTGPFRG